MHALRFHEFGDVSKLKWEDLPDVPPGKDEIKVRVHAASINPSDVKNVQGKMEGTTLPRIPGRDFAGIIVEGQPNLIGREVWGTGGDIGYSRDGSHAEYITIPVGAAAAKPANLSFEEAACVGVNYIVAYEGLIHRAKVQPGEIVLVTGSGGGVGTAVLELAQAFGARLIAADRKPCSEADYQRVKLLGYVDTDKLQLADAVRGIAGPRGVDVVYDCVGGPLFEPALSTLGQMGRQICITSAGTRRAGFDLVDFYHRRLTLLGVDSRALGVEQSAHLLELMAPLFVSGELKPSKIVRRGTLQEGPDLYAEVDKGAGGKIVFVMR